ncbi:MAG: GerAB/ArcD/ProY family transporter [Dehalobacterium sp.]|jgi:spore germination protein KB
MGLEKGKVSSLETIFLMFGFIFGGVIVSPGSVAGKDFWLAPLLGFIILLPLGAIYVALLNRFQGKTIIEINEIIFGPIPGGLLSGFFLWFLFHSGALILMSYLDFFKQLLLPNTPAEIIVFLMAALTIYGVKMGLEVIMRTGLMIVPVTMIVLMLLFLFALPVIEVSNIRPLFTTSWPKMMWAGFGVAVQPCAETVAFLMILPFLNKPGQVKITFFLGLILGCIGLSLSALRSILVLGESAGMYLYPSYYAIKMINIADILNRFEILIAINYLAMGFIKATVYLYGLSLGFAQLFKFDSYRPVVPPLGFLMALFALFNMHNVAEKIEFANKAFPLYALPFVLGVPLIALVGSWLKGIKGGASQ